MKKVTEGSDNPYLTSATPDDLGPADPIACDIVAERRDLLPSVERIMSAGLEEDDTVGALTLLHRAGHRRRSQLRSAGGDRRRHAGVRRCGPTADQL